MNVVRRLWNDDAGFVVSAELILVATLLVIGLIVGLSTYRDALVQELGDTGAAVGQLDQSYNYNQFALDRMFGTVRVQAFVAGSEYEDNTDLCDGEDPDGMPPAGITIGLAPTPEGEDFP